jgi:hypothetical protein
VHRLRGDEFFLVALIVLNVLLLFGLLPDWGRIVSAAAVALILVSVLLLLSPSRLIFGKRTSWWDALLLLAFLLIDAPLVRTIFLCGSEIATAFASGAVIMIVLGFLILPRGERSLLARFGLKGWRERMLILAFELLFLVTLFSLALTWQELAMSPLPAMLLALGALWALHRHRQHAHPMSVFSILAIAGLFLLRYLTDGIALLRGFALLRNALQSSLDFTNAGFANILLFLLLLIAYVALLLLPIYMWYKTYRLHTRPAHEHERTHHPDLPGWLLALVCTSLSAALILRVFSLIPEMPLFGAALRASPFSAANPEILLVLLGCLFSALLVLSVSRKIRHVLMTGLFIGLLLFLAFYVYVSFTATLRYALAETLTLFMSASIVNLFCGAWLLLILIAQLVFLVFGYLGFVYELARD